MKMICSILLLLSLTSCVSGAFEVKVKQSSYQAEENHNITLEWMFTTRTGSSSKSLFIYCELSAEPIHLVLFHLYRGVEDPESQDEQFTGRVRWDKDVLRDGRIRLHMSRLRINDSGVYRCDMQTGYGTGSRICHLNVTAADDEPKPPTPTMRPQPEIWGWIALYVIVGLIAALLVFCAGLYFSLRLRYTRERGIIYRAVQMLSFSENQPIRTNLEGNLQAAKTCRNSYEIRCPTTYPNLNHSRSMSNLNHSRSMSNLNHSRSMSNLNHSRSMPNLSHSSL